MGYATRKRPPRSLTVTEQNALLKVTGKEKDSYRDHMIFALAMGTGLRKVEIASLNVGDVYTEKGYPKAIISLRIYKGTNGEEKPVDWQEVHVPNALTHKLRRFWEWKKQKREGLGSNDPLFLSERNQRISTRAMQDRFAVWQERAGFERHLKFHELRHTCGTNLYRKTKDLLLVQRQMRHANIETTVIYTHPSDEDVRRGVEGLPC